MFDSLFPSHWTTLRKLMWLKLKGASAAWSTISGNPVSFTAKAAPLRQLEVAFSPVQSLNGYDAPWPAGGGKNKLSISPSIVTKTQYGVTFTINRNSAGDVTSIVANGTSTTRNYFSLGRYDISGGTVLNGCPAGGAYGTYTLGIDGTTISDTGNGATIESDMTNAALQIVIARDYVCNNLTFKPMIRLASVSDATFAPYSNECPISGWDSLTVEQRGVNLWDGQYEVGNILSDGTDGTSDSYRRVKGFIPIKGGESYYMVHADTGDRFYYYDKDKNFLLYDYNHNPSTAPQNAAYLRSMWNKTNVPTPSETVSINYPSTDHDYHAYNPSSRSISISLGSTVYSGVLDLVTGVGEVTWVTDVFTQFAGSAEANGFRLSNTLSHDPKQNYPNLICNMFKRANSYAESVNVLASADNWNKLGSNLQGGILCNAYANGEKVTTIEALNALIPAEGCQVTYEIATPLPIQLTPQEVESLAGDNTMWSDGDSLEVTYRSN